MTESRRWLWLMIGALLLCAAPSTVAAQEPAAADTTSTATPQETGLQRAQRLAQEALDAGTAGTAGTAAGDDTLGTDAAGDAPYLSAWTRTPEITMQAAMQKLVWGGSFRSGLTFRDQSAFTQKVGYSLEDFRSQEKTVELRDGSASYTTGTQHNFNGTLNLSNSWSRDEVTNTAGRTNVNLRDYKSGIAMLRQDSLSALGTLSNLRVGGTLTQQQSEQLGMRNDFNDAQLDGLLNSGWDAGDWLHLRTGVYGMTRSGEKTLGALSSASTAGGDSLRAGVFFDRIFWQGGFSVTRSNFEDRYIDYRRNANGIIDTIGVTQKIVQELERDDAVTLQWDNRLLLGPFNIGANFSRDVSENSFRASGVGVRERHQDNVDLDLGFRATRLDSVRVSYQYLWKWDDQTFRGATMARGRQISKRYNVKVDWIHDLFAGTNLKVLFTDGIAQEIAERGFNKNDRDRMETSVTAKTDSRWDNGFVVNLSFDARRVEDTSIRRERSANNTMKDTYEIAPSYLWPLADWLDVDQSFRVWIQYTDYVFSEYDTVDKQDDYNKRANLNTKFTLRPSRRLRLTIRHDYNFKSNAKKTRTDTTGNSFYNTDQEQRVSKVDFAMSWTVTPWLTLDATTFKTHDLTETFGTRPNETDRYSGELAVGGSVQTKSRSGARVLALAVHKVFAEGPSIQKYASEYWDADISYSWRF